MIKNICCKILSIVFVVWYISAILLLLLPSLLSPLFGIGTYIILNFPVCFVLQICLHTCVWSSIDFRLSSLKLLWGHPIYSWLFLTSTFTAAFIPLSKISGSISKDFSLKEFIVCVSYLYSGSVYCFHLFYPDWKSYFPHWPSNTPSTGFNFSLEIFDLLEESCFYFCYTVSHCTV